MNGYMKTLRKVLQRKINLYGKYALLQEEEWEHIVQYNLEQLEAILDQKENLVVDLQQLEAYRIKLMKKIAEKLGVPAAGLTLKKLTHNQEDPVCKSLARCREKLLDQINVIKEWDSRIQALMDKSSLSFKKSLVFVHSADEKAGSPYHSNGQRAERKMESRLLSMEI